MKRPFVMPVAILSLALTACTHLPATSSDAPGAYYVGHYTITDPDGYSAYTAVVGPILDAHDGEILVADGDSAIVEGAPGPVTIVLKFPTRADLENWYNSPEYQEIIALRTDNADTAVTFANGFRAPR